MLVRLIPRSFLSTLTFLAFVGTTRGQHDGARDSVRHLVDKKFEKVAETLEKKKPFAGDAESAFVEMLGLLMQDKPEAALVRARAAVDQGLPFERLIVGPRSQLKKLHALPAFSSWRAEQDLSPLIHGPMIGNVTDRSASFWVRTSREADVTVRLRDSQVASPVSRASRTSDFTAIVSLQDLPPNSDISYEVEIDGQKVASGSFPTFPRRGEAGVFSVGFGGGAGYVPEWESMWDTIAGFEPNAFLMLGDNVYIDQPTSELTQRYCYYRRQSRPEWKRLVSATPIYSIWDDHDFGTNDCVPGPDIDRPAWKREVWTIFRENWVNPAYGGGESQPGCWYDFHVGDVHFILLDGRYYRDLKRGSMLGSAQKKWLFETLRQSKATFKVIASPVPFTAGIKKGSRDPWDGFPEEREEIFRYIETNRIPGVFLIAADRHRTDLRVTRRTKGYDLFEFESSRLTNHHTHPVVKTDGLLWGYNEKCSFALMSFDTTAADPQVTFQCVSIDGTTEHTYILKRSRLESPPEKLRASPTSDDQAVLRPSIPLRSNRSSSDPSSTGISSVESQRQSTRFATLAGS